MDRYCKMGIKGQLEAVRGLVLNGLSYDEICLKIGISRRMFEGWRKKYPEFDEAVAGCAALVDGQLVESAVRQALGYYVEEDKAFKVKDFRAMDGVDKPIERVEVVRIRRYVEPSGNVSMFMLRNKVGLGEEDGSIVVADERLQEWGG